MYVFTCLSMKRNICQIDGKPQSCYQFYILLVFPSFTFMQGDTRG